ncbi:MAG: CPBP family intramembrane metalloprotease [Proteobacteria bacterium]|nr:CPBP family intramembrane metalloprotease [Pseudomonadota bacterium]
MRTFLWFVFLMALALAAIALLSYPAWLLLHPHFDFPFHRIGERVGMLAVLVAFILGFRRLGLANLASLGYGVGRAEFLREMALAFVLAVLLMLAAVSVMQWLGLLDWSRAAATLRAGLLPMGAKRLASAFAIAFIEESCLRGAMFAGVQRESGTRTAIVLTALVFMATHFFASYHIAPDQVTPRSGLVLVAGTLQAFASPLANADAFLALFAVGVLLGMVRAGTGNIAACVGLHAGWVWVILVVHELAMPRADSSLGFLLSRFDGFVGWLVFAWTFVLALPLWLFYRARAGRAN